jgi:hypothetical protein
VEAWDWAPLTETGVGGGGGTLAIGASCTPQFWQNISPGVFAYPQAEHVPGVALTTTGEAINGFMMLDLGGGETSPAPLSTHGVLAAGFSGKPQLSQNTAESLT